jgi:hypothetical protein
LGGEVVILGFKNGFYYGLNKSATRIWQLLQEPTTVGEVLEILMEEYEVERDRCKDDLLELLDGLSARGLVEIRSPNQG